MTEILNLDELAPTPREVKLKGETYPVMEMSVDDYIELQKIAKKIDTNSIESMIDTLVTVICRLIPSMPEEIVRKMPDAQLNALMTFLNLVGAEGAPEEGKSEASTSE